MGKYCHCTHPDKKNWDGGIVKFGRPFLGRYVKMGQSRTWDGWGIQMSLKNWDFLYGRSPGMIQAEDFKQFFLFLVGMFPG